MQDICVEKLMTKDITCVGPDMDLKEVVKLMRENTYSFLVVTNNKIPVGIITEQDIVRILDDFLEKSSTTFSRVSDFMSTPPVVLRLGTTLIEAFEVSQRLKIGHLLVVDASGEIAGLVTQSDLSRAHFQVVEKQRKTVENTIATRTKELLRTNEHFKMLALEDSLLCIGNRRAMEIDLEYTHETAKRYNRSYCIVLFDIDHFKQYNDYYGHLAGDKLLIQVAGYLKRSIRQPDRIYRYGGEEFLVLLPETSMDDVPALGQRLVTGIANLRIPHVKAPQEIVTVSGGIGSGASLDGTKLSWREVLAEADRGLYHSKRNGRNQISIDRFEVSSGISSNH
ncbi:MAG: diguanylate cyclase [Nitrospiria bacterium]